MDDQKEKGLVLVARNPGFGLPTACPSCLPVYLYLRFANASFDLHFHPTSPDSGLYLSLSCSIHLFLFLGFRVVWMFWKNGGLRAWWNHEPWFPYQKLQRRMTHIAWFLIFMPPQMIVWMDGRLVLIKKKYSIWNFGARLYAHAMFDMYVESLILGFMWLL